MSKEDQTLDQKSLRYALGKHADAHGLACDCVGFANARGGTILLGIEDGQDDPRQTQRVPEDLADRLRKRLAQISEIHDRIRKEIPRRKIRRELAELVATKEIGTEGIKRGTVYIWTK